MLEIEIADARDGIEGAAAPRGSRLSTGARPPTYSSDENVFCDTDSEHMSSL